MFRARTIQASLPEIDSQSSCPRLITFLKMITICITHFHTKNTSASCPQCVVIYFLWFSNKYYFHGQHFYNEPETGLLNII
jgi:hypothetical protein